MDGTRLTILTRGSHPPQSDWLDKALRSLGHEVLPDSALARKYDALLVHDAAAVDRARLKACRHSGAKTILRAYRDPDSFVTHRGVIESYDWVLTTGMAEMRKLYESEGGCALSLLPASPPCLISQSEHLPVRRDIDILFAGRLDGPERLQRLEVLKQAQVHWRVAVATGSGEWPGAYPLDEETLIQLQRRARLALHVDRVAINRFGITRACAGLRPFAAPAAGCVLLVQLLPWLNQCFDPASELAGFSDVAHAIEVASALLEQPTQLKTIAQAARRRCRAEHTATDRAQQIISLVHGVVPLKMHILGLGPWYQQIELPGGQRTSHLAHSNVKRWSRLRAFLPNLDGKHVLDLGMNAGFFSLKCTQQGAARIVGIEKSQLACAQARFVLDTCKIGNVKVIEGDFLAVPEESFDLCLLLAVLHHVSDIRPLLALATRRAAEILIEWNVRPRPYYHPIEEVICTLQGLNFEAQVLAGGPRPILRAVPRSFVHDRHKIDSSDRAESWP